MRPVFQHITVPVDGSTTSVRGIAFALELARDGGRVSFCSVVDPALSDAGAVQEAELFCQRAQDAAGKLGIVCDTQVFQGSCIDEITSFAARNGSNAIVIGTNGRTGLARAVLGSVAEGVMRHSVIPVVTVHADDDMRTGPLAVAMDSSPAAQAALDVGISIAAARRMKSMIVYVCSSTTVPAPANMLLERAAERARNHGIATQLVMREGGAAEELLAAAEDDDCCMLVMGTHGRSQLARFAVGSVAMAVVERAHVPVVTVRSPRTGSRGGDARTLGRGEHDHDPDGAAGRR